MSRLEIAGALAFLTLIGGGQKSITRDAGVDGEPIQEAAGAGDAGDMGLGGETDAICNAAGDSAPIDLNFFNGVFEDAQGVTVDLSFGSVGNGNPFPFAGQLVKRGNATKFTNSSLSGLYILKYDTWVGYFTFDGNGNLSANVLFTGDNGHLNKINPVTGTYTVNADGSATIHVSQAMPAGSGKPSDFENATWTAVLLDNTGSKVVFVSFLPALGKTVFGTLQKQG